MILMLRLQDQRIFKDNFSWFNISFLALLFQFPYSFISTPLPNSRSSHHLRVSCMLTYLYGYAYRSYTSFRFMRHAKVLCDEQLFVLKLSLELCAHLRCFSFRNEELLIQINSYAYNTLEMNTCYGYAAICMKARCGW